MGSLFKTPKVEGRSGLSKSQQALLDQLVGSISPDIGQTPAGYDQLLAGLLGANTEESKTLAERMYREAYLTPALREFDTQVAPRIAASFSSIGGTQSSRRGQTIADALTTLQTNALGNLAAQLPNIQSFPLQQILGQVQGLGALQSIKYGPFSTALPLATQQTVQNVQSPAGPGWGLLGSAIQTAGFVAGSKLGGK